MWEEETLVLNIKWEMEFNTDKCEIMHVGRRNPGFEYKMGNGIQH